MDSHICICCGGRMAAVSPRNPNLCLGCEQVVEDGAPELERLLFAAGHPGTINPIESDPPVGELFPLTAYHPASADEHVEEHHVFVAPA